MFGCLATSTIFGVRMQAEQSSVGNVLSSMAMWPPMVACFSTMTTLKPASAMSSAAWMPATPPPTTIAAGRTSTKLGCSSHWRTARRTAAATDALAFSVASSLRPS